MRVLVTGSGYVGSFLVTELAENRNVSHLAYTYQSSGPLGSLPKTVQIYKMDLSDFEEVSNVIQESAPDVVVHTAALTNTAKAEEDPSLAEAVNVDGTRHLVKACASQKNPPHVIHFSTDWVYSGDEILSSETRGCIRPFGEYGRTKSRGEKIYIEEEYPRFTVLRSALVYGPAAPSERRGSFIQWLCNKIYGQEDVFLFSDEWRSPIYVLDIARVVNVALSSLDKINHEVLNLGGERLSRLEMGFRVTDVLGRGGNFINATTIEERCLHRPRDLSMNSSRLFGLLEIIPTSFKDALCEFLQS